MRCNRLIVILLALILSQIGLMAQTTGDDVLADARIYSVSRWLVAFLEQDQQDLFTYTCWTDQEDLSASVYSFYPPEEFRDYLLARIESGETRSGGIDLSDLTYERLFTTVDRTLVRLDGTLTVADTMTEQFTFENVLVALVWEEQQWRVCNYERPDLQMYYELLQEIEQNRAEQLPDLSLFMYYSIWQIPPEIATLTHLKEFTILENRISELPGEILGTLVNLEKLDIINTPSTEIPPEIGNLKKLRELQITVHDIKTLPPEIGNLRRLEFFNLYLNILETLPPEIGNLHRLETLLINENNLMELPPEIGNLRRLVILELNSNQLEALPPEIGNLHRLELLDLNENQLEALPPEIGNLQNLQTLMLQWNNLADLPPELANLTQLKTLTVDAEVALASVDVLAQMTIAEKLIIYFNRNPETVPEDVLAAGEDALIEWIEDNQP